MNQWSAVVEYIRSHVGEQTFKTWFDPIGVLSFTSDSIDLEVPNRFYLSWLTDNYLDVIKQSLFQITRRSIDIRFHVSNSSSNTFSAVQAPFPETEGNSQTLQNFVFCPDNQFLYDVINEISLSAQYNPLYIYGKKGTGKTHLLKAIKANLIDHIPTLNVRYLPCDQFIIDIDNHLRNESLFAFRSDLISADVLLFDDVQKLSGKYYHQQEIQYVLTYLNDFQKQVVLTADRLPIDIPSITDSIRSRVSAGLIIQLFTADIKSKKRILRMFCALENIHLSTEIIDFLARINEHDMNRLHNYIVRLGAVSSLEGKNLTLDTAEEIIKRQSKDVKSEVMKITATVAHYFNVTTEDILSSRKTRTVAVARRVAMYFCRIITDLSFSQIGSLFMGKDHSTVLKAYKRIVTDLSSDTGKMQHIIREISM